MTHSTLIMQLQVTTKTPSECTDITEVRAEIDHIDQAIIELIGQRFGYVKEVVKYKDRTAKAIEANDRRESMKIDRRVWAEQNGLSADVIERMYDMLVEYFIAEEKKLIE